MSGLISMILYMVMSIMVLLSVAFLTLLERKILGYIQVRKGPNKVLWKGALQPIMDALKLFSKELSLSVLFNKLLYNFMSFFSLFLTLMMWLIYSFNLFEEYLLSLLYVFVLMSMSIYWLMGSGWASNSKYTLLGCYRSGAQVISYEVGLIFLFLCFFEFSGFFSINVQLSVMIKSYKFIFVFWFMFVVWLTILMAEMNRAPFDFAESESELVSGFNVEYGGSKFAFLFLAEYGSMLLMAYLTLLIFMMNLIFFYMLVIFLIIWVRGVFPRYRYDNLMYLNWKVFLPFILLIFLNVIVLKNLMI